MRKSKILIIKKIIQKNKKLILFSIVIFVTTLIPILAVKNSNKRAESITLQDAPRATNYIYQNTSKDFKIYLGNRSSKQIPEVKMAIGNSSIDFSPDKKVSAKTKLSKNNQKGITYENVYPGINISYSLKENGIKEEIIIRDKQAALNYPLFTFKLNLKNAIPQVNLTDNSAITFIDSVSKKYLFHFEKPFMIDGGGNRSENVELKIKTISDPNSESSPHFQIIVIPDSNWLKNALYPVVIDPTLTLEDADTVGNWTSSDTANLPISQDTSDKQEGTGSIQVAAAKAYEELTYDGTFIIHPSAPGNSCYGLGNSYGPSVTHSYPWYYGYDFGAGESYIFRKYGMRHVTANFGGKDILVQGSNDWSSFTTLKSAQTVNDTNYQEWTFDNSTAYRYIRFYNTNGWSSGEWYHRTADHRVYTLGSYLNDTVTTDLGAGSTQDLTDYPYIKFWVKSTITGTYLQFGIGETAWNDNTTNITINSADTWEEKTWDISGISSGDKDAIRYLGFKVTDETTDFTMKFDDIRAYLPNYSPSAPDSLLTEGQTNPTSIIDTTPEFSAIYNDNDSGDIANKYRIQVDDDSEFGSPIWDSGESGTAMSNCDEGDRCEDISYAGSALSEGVTYYWRIKFWDDTPAEGDWSTEEAYFSLNSTPSAPTSLQTESQTNPSGVNDTTPEFSAVYNDLDSGDIANKYRIQVDDDPAFGSPLWDSGESGTAMSNCNQGERCSDISYGGNSTDLQWNSRYYWRIKYWDDEPSEGEWSTESAYFTMSPIYKPTGCLIDDSGQPGELTIKWSDNTDLETGYRIEKSADEGAWALLSTEAANTTSKTDVTVSSNHTYVYRIRAESDNGNSQWCSTSQVDYSKGNLQMKGILVR